MILLHAAFLMAAQVLQPVTVPEPALPAPATVVDEIVAPDDAAAISARKRLNAEVKARTDASDAGYAAAQAAYQAQMREHDAAVARTAQAQAEYDAARAAYDQRQREIADWQACVNGDKTRCPPKPQK
ncbi:hypothetical protein [Sphingosinicella microcystinivorans]|uniref:Uncharacterized protein n=1 Tax=Sphingosinicella microcystinivorans TaxID=335406 RepID=A0AAD1G2I3_SPHMI|nr:hypothetical protein [Sphingosinicella microcystinivorans]RKS88230.1 hypothetical protein DFR51_2878 [Sphingosinicella microcystinivorans]BBE36042.1 hypothetical protein SmB9_37000 [Sphingosinicella microcystinivorans]